ncbi:unnamed protein product [Moneuplotes crassus]|uniref:Uncharacterized protein n=1 Tax=Euplotes crassus TaxID=5936 RepID=A0AAD1XZ77_EUPCR|nr:unnamed protein product [Moneuplotes crassus]
MYKTQGPGYYYSKFSPLNPKYLSILCENDLQVVENNGDDYKLLYVNRLGSRFDSIRCIEWSKDPANPLTLATGFKNGRVALISYTDENGTQNMERIVSGSIVKEFVQKSSRSSKKCNALAWNEHNPSLLAAGYDWTERSNSSNQYSIVIWDVNKETKAQETNYDIYAPYVGESNFKKEYVPIDIDGEKRITKRNKIEIIKECKYSLSKKDDSTALVWLNDENSKLLSGTNKGSIKLLDLLGSSQNEINAHKKRVTSIKLSPFNSNIIASCCEDQVRVFDLRKMKTPVIQINHDVKEIEFSNYHSYVLATIHSKKDANTVKFWNINNAIQEKFQEDDASCLELEYPFSMEKCKQEISSLTWLPKVEDEEHNNKNKYLVVGDGGTLLHTHTYRNIDCMPVSFSSLNELAFSNGDKVFFYDFMSQNLKKMNENVSAHKDGAVDSGDFYPPDTSHEDISDLVCKRINHGYGLDINRNVEISQNFSYQGIRVVWRWLQTIESLMKGSQKNMISVNFEEYHKGIAYLFENQPTSQNIPENPEIQEECLKFMDTTIYSGQDRSMACKMCGWTDVLQTHSTRVLKSTIKSKVDSIGKQDPVRATCVAACHFDFSLAAVELSSSIQENKYDEEPSNLSLMRTVFMIFNEIHKKNQVFQKGENEEFYKSLKNTIWKNGYKMRNEYFNWVMTLFNSPHAALEGFKKIDFLDKIAAFCRFFPKDLLKETISKLIDKGIKEGNLETIVLTGFQDRCHEVLQSYVDVYGDFQTPALIACYYMKYVKEKDPRVTKWIMEYRKYLSKIRLWNIRCNFDVNRIALIKKSKNDTDHDSDIKTQLKKYEHTIFCPLPMCETNIGIAHNSEEEKHAISIAGTSASRGIHRAVVNPSAQFSKTVSHCKCTNQINCSVCSLAMHRINPSFKSSLPLDPSSDGFRKSRSESSIYNFSPSSQRGANLKDLKLNFTDWFSWCNTCKHVGHLQCVEEWFSYNSECPIPDCHCQCKLQCPI